MAAEEEEVEGISMPPGDPDGVEEIAGAFAGVAGQLRGAAGRLRAAPGEVGSWRGASSVAFAGACLVGAGDADDRADSMERASAGARRFAGDLREARTDARTAMRDAREAREQIEDARRKLNEARDRRTKAEGKIAAAEATIGTAAALGAPAPGVEEARNSARDEVDVAERDERIAQNALGRAEEKLETAQQRGREARQRAREATRGMRDALVMLSPSGPIALMVGAPLGAGGSPAAGASPGAVAAFFKRLGPQAATALARSHPEAVGPLDGAPVGMRYLANRALAGREADRLRGELDDVESELEEENADWRDLLPLVSPFPMGREVVDGLTTSREEELEARHAELTAELGTARAFTAEHRQLLLYDPLGDGQVAEVFGDLEDAKHATVSVPGIGNDLAGFDDEFRGEVQDLYNAANLRSDQPVASVAWLGYDSPDGLSDGATYTNASADEGWGVAGAHAGWHRCCQPRCAHDRRGPQLRVGRGRPGRRAPRAAGRRPRADGQPRPGRGRRSRVRSRRWRDAGVGGQGAGRSDRGPAERAGDRLRLDVLGRGPWSRPDRAGLRRAGLRHRAAARAVLGDRLGRCAGS